MQHRFRAAISLGTFVSATLNAMRTFMWGADVRVRMESSYPWNGNMRMQVHASGPFDLALRGLAGARDIPYASTRKRWICSR